MMESYQLRTEIKLIDEFVNLKMRILLILVPKLDFTSMENREWVVRS